MYSISDLQKLIQMLAYLGIIGPGSYPAHSVVLGAGANAAPGAARTLLGSNGTGSDPSFQTLAALGIAPFPLPANSVGSSQLANNAVTDIAVAAAAAIQSSKLSYSQGAAGAIARSIQAKFQDEIWLTDFGGDPTGATDSLSAWNNAIAAAVAGRKRLRIGPGKFSLSASVSYTFPAATGSLIIDGSGADVTEITFPNTSSGLVFDYNGPYNSVHIRGLSITTAQANAGTAGIDLVQTVTTIANPANTALSDISDVTIRGADGYDVADYWTYGIRINSVSNVNFTGITVVGANFNGTGCYIFGSTTAIPVVYNFSLCTFNELNKGFIYGTNVQGVSFSQCNFTGNNYGIFAAAGENALDQLAVIGSQFNNFTSNIELDTHVDATMIQGNLFLVQNNTTSINLGSFSNTCINGNVFANAVGVPSNINGIVFGTYATFGSASVTGNSFTQMTTGVLLNAASQFVNVQSNSYWNCTNKAINNGTNNTLGGGSV